MIALQKRYINVNKIYTARNVYSTSLGTGGPMYIFLLVEYRVYSVHATARGIPRLSRVKILCDLYITQLFSISRQIYPTSVGE